MFRRQMAWNEKNRIRKEMADEEIEERIQTIGKQIRLYSTRHM